ncbi:MAG: pitrilysin family protein [Chloroflexota bacterium]|nr:pitrilysin family protein [Chloroflexota bacterium]
MYQKSVLDSGLRIVTSTMPGTRSVAVMVFIGAGSVYERAEHAGTSHFVEHVLFKGTERRRTSKEISEAIERVGGTLNGATSKEVTTYWCKVARPHFPLALDLLVDMLLHSRFDPSDVERERQIIIEELNESMDSPQHRVNMLIDDIIWMGQPLGRDVIGTRDTVAAIGRDTLLDYKLRQYVPNNAVVTVAGDIGHDEAVSCVAEAFAGWATGSPVPHFPTDDAQEEPRVRVERREAEQAHLCVAVRGLPILHPDRFRLDMLNVILGEGMSSRLFVEIRERLGLSYDIYCYVQHLSDSGALTVYAGVDPKRAEAAVKAILEQVRLLKEGVTEAELTRAKEYAKGRLLLRMEDTRNVAGWLGGQESLTGRIYTPDDVVSIVDAMTTEGLKRVANQVLLPQTLNLAIVGPVDHEERFRDMLTL